MVTATIALAKPLHPNCLLRVGFVGGHPQNFGIISGTRIPGDPEPKLCPRRGVVAVWVDEHRAARGGRGGRRGRGAGELGEGLVARAAVQPERVVQRVEGAEAREEPPPERVL
eukprot:gene4064-biopygen4009